MKELFKDLRDRLKKVKDQNGKSIWVDLFKNQFAREKTEKLLPAAFIRLGNVDWKPSTSQDRIGVVNGSVYVGQDLYADTYESDEGDFFDLIEEITVSLNGFEGETFTPLVITRTELSEEYSEVAVHIISFRTVVTIEAKEENLTDMPTQNITI